MWRTQWNPTPVLLPGKSHGRRSLVGCRPRGCRESDRTERRRFLSFLLWSGVALQRWQFLLYSRGNQLSVYVCPLVFWISSPLRSPESPEKRPLCCPAGSLVCVRSVVSDSAAPWTAARQSALPLGFSRHESWSGVPFPSPGESS